MEAEVAPEPPRLAARHAAQAAPHRQNGVYQIVAVKQEDTDHNFVRPAPSAEWCTCLQACTLVSHLSQPVSERRLSPCPTKLVPVTVNLTVTTPSPIMEGVPRRDVHSSA